MACQRCASDNVFRLNAKCDDRCDVRTPTKEYEGYVPYHLGVGGGDYVNFSVCADCGQMQGRWPKDLNDEE